MTYVPSGFDRADGVGGRLGTPSPAGNILYQTPFGTTGIANTTIEESSESPEIERAEQATLTHTFKMSWDNALTQIQFLGRGTVFTDSNGNVTKVLSSKVQRAKGGLAQLTVTSESLSFDSPPDQFSIVPVELGVNIIKHPRYFYALNGSNSDEYLRNQSVIRVIQNYMENPTPDYRNWWAYALQASFGSPGTVTGNIAVSGGLVTPSGGTAAVQAIPGTDMAKAAALEILEKYWKGEETPYVIGYQIVWSSFYFRPAYLNPGGYIEDPIYDASPGLPNYFWSPTFPASAATMFDLLGEINPQCYSSTGLSSGAVNISWLRKADQMEEQRTWFKVDRTWIGSPVGFWDQQLYGSVHRPQVTGDYNYNSVPDMQAIPSGLNPKVT